MLFFQVCDFAVLMCGLRKSTQEMAHSNTTLSPEAHFRTKRAMKHNSTHVVGLLFLANRTFAARKR